jgi:hypothetical protein
MCGRWLTVQCGRCTKPRKPCKAVNISAQNSSNRLNSASKPYKGVYQSSAEGALQETRTRNTVFVHTARLLNGLVCDCGSCVFSNARLHAFDGILTLMNRLQSIGLIRAPTSGVRYIAVARQWTPLRGAMLLLLPFCEIGPLHPERSMSGIVSATQLVARCRAIGTCAKWCLMITAHKFKAETGA